MPTALTREELAKRIREAIETGPSDRLAIADYFDISVQSVDSWMRTGRIGKDKLLPLAQLTGRPIEHFLGSSTTSQLPRLDRQKLVDTYATINSLLAEDGRFFDMRRHVDAFVLVYEEGGKLASEDLARLRQMLQGQSTQEVGHGFGETGTTGKASGPRAGRDSTGRR